MKKILYLLVLLPMVTAAQENYIKTTVYKEPTLVSIPTPTAQQATESVTFYDGLGRPKQQLASKQSATGKNIVTHIEYDPFGRQVKEYLPYANGATGVDIDPTALNGTMNFPQYAGQSPFSEKQIESSPLGRVFKQAAPGTAWAMGSGNEIIYDYQANAASEVLVFTATSSEPTAGLYAITLNQTLNNFYPAGQLYKTIIKDENWVSGTDHLVEEFRDKQGVLILKRTYTESVFKGILQYSPHDTYYVYDQYGNLTYVLPPAIEKVIVITPTVLNGLSYQYKYDYRNRVVEKKIPGKQWEFMVYDKLNRTVATGPALPPFTDGTENGWLTTKYDAFNRQVLSTWLAISASQPATEAGRKSLQTSRNSDAILNESRTAAVGSPVNNVACKYSTLAWPVSNYHTLSVSYYDDYNFPGAPTSPFPTVLGQTVAYTSALPPRGTQTGSWSRVAELLVTNPVRFESGYSLFDYKARPIRSSTTNYLGGATTADTNYDFSKIVYTETKHKRLAADTDITVREDFTYSAQQRMLTRTHAINGTIPAQLLSDNTYNEIGQLISKKVGNTSVAPFQKVDYTYNIRGWLKQINNVADLGLQTDNVTPESPADLFGFQINYNDPNASAGNAVALYNGNISQTLWKTSSDAILREYSYAYDPTNRLLDAAYEKSATPGPDSYAERNITYDRNGNIMTLQRNGAYDDTVMPPFEIDELDYTYSLDSNQLKYVNDGSSEPEGFNNFNINADDFSYDDFGNMTIDKNKSITLIKYNHLNLPVEILFAATPNKKITYLYNAAGVKVCKVVKEPDPNIFGGFNTTTTDYLNGFQYTNTKLSFFPTAEGYVNNVVSGGNNVYSYVFNYLDHLGNIRVSYGKVGGIFKIIEENHYYPFGLKHSNYNSQLPEARLAEAEARKKGGNATYAAPIARKVYQYKYNGKEYQDELGLNFYNYGARNYDPALGRWMNIDPLAEKMRRWSPYSYCVDNPIYFIDPDGMIIHLNFGSALAKQMYIATITKAMGGMYTATSDPLLGGKVEVTSTGAQGPMTEQQQAFHDEYTAVVNSSVDVNMGVEVVSATTNVGSWETGKLDMTDVSKFDRAGEGGATSAGAVIHETVEQFEKAKLGLKSGEISKDPSIKEIALAPEFVSSHATATSAENRVNGNTRVENADGTDTFTEKNGTTTTQTYSSFIGGGFGVTKINNP